MFELKMFGTLERLRMLYHLGEDSFLQTCAVCTWIRTVADDGDVVRVEFPDYAASFSFARTSRRQYTRVKPREDAATSRFFVGPPSRSTPQTSLTRIFSSPDIKVWESQKRATGLAPLRFGLSTGEREQALQLARSTISEILTGDTVSEHEVASLRFSLLTDVDVALWVKGEIRGSWVVTGKSLKEGIEEAARKMLLDHRFKPLAARELTEARIEITLLNPLHVPLSRKSLRENVISPEKGYTLSSGRRRGWFLPAVLNVRAFKDLNHFLGELAEEKAGIPREARARARVEVFEVEDFVESADRTRSILLRGPMPTPDKTYERENSERRFRMAAEWLCVRQEEDGNIPPVLDPLTGVSRQIGWVRLAFTALSLAEFGAAADEPRYTAASLKTFRFLYAHIVNNQRAIPQKELTCVYLGRAALRHGRTADAGTLRAILLGHGETLAFDPIAYAHIAGFLALFSNEDTKAHSQRVTMETVLKEQFRVRRERGARMPLAEWAEAVNLFAVSDTRFSREVSDWLVSQQLESGAFPVSAGSDVAHARGTGKVFEVLALKPEHNKVAIEKALSWLFSMQYDDDSMFFIHPDIRPKALGAFRHDYLNHEAWIDAVGHMLLGAARLAAFSTAKLDKKEQ